MNNKQRKLHDIRFKNQMRFDGKYKNLAAWQCYVILKKKLDQSVEKNEKNEHVE